MFHPILKEKYEFITAHFEKLFNVQSDAKPFPHSIILSGVDVLGQYYIALSIARWLNCVGTKKFDCDCINCKWIKSNTHPEVRVISKIDGKPENDSTKTVISEKQIKALLNEVSRQSGYKKVFILCDAAKKELSPNENEHYKSFSTLGFEPIYQTESKCWFPSGITRKTLQDTAANSLLKSIEEPPEDTFFIFLTHTKEDLLSTIISRSQAFYVPSGLKESYNTTEVAEILNAYPNIKKIRALELSERLLNIETTGTSYLFDTLQSYFTELMKCNTGNPELTRKILSDIETVQTAKQMLNASMKDSIVTDYLMLKICV